MRKLISILLLLLFANPIFATTPPTPKTETTLNIEITKNTADNLQSAAEAFFNEIKIKKEEYGCNNENNEKNEENEKNAFCTQPYPQTEKFKDKDKDGITFSNPAKEDDFKEIVAFYNELKTFKDLLTTFENTQNSKKKREIIAEIDAILAEFNLDDLIKKLNEENDLLNKTFGTTNPGIDKNKTEIYEKELNNINENITKYNINNNITEDNELKLEKHGNKIIEIPTIPEKLNEETEEDLKKLLDDLKRITEETKIARENIEKLIKNENKELAESIKIRFADLIKAINEISRLELIIYAKYDQFTTDQGNPFEYKMLGYSNGGNTTSIDCVILGEKIKEDCMTEISESQITCKDDIGTCSTEMKTPLKYSEIIAAINESTITSNKRLNDWNDYIGKLLGQAETNISNMERYIKNEKDKCDPTRQNFTWNDTDQDEILETEVNKCLNTLNSKKCEDYATEINMIYNPPKNDISFNPPVNTSSNECNVINEKVFCEKYAQINNVELNSFKPESELGTDTKDYSQECKDYVDEIIENQKKVGDIIAGLDNACKEDKTLEGNKGALSKAITYIEENFECPVKNDTPAPKNIQDIAVKISEIFKPNSHYPISDNKLLLLTCRNKYQFTRRFSTKAADMLTGEPKCKEE